VNNRLANAVMVVNSPRSPGGSAWPNAAPIYSPLDFFGPARSILGSALSLARAPLTGTHGLFDLAVEFMCSYLPRTPLFFVRVHAR
jgi:hypothetical protein